MCPRAVEDRQQPVRSRQTFLLDLDEALVDPPPEGSPIKHRRRRSPRPAADANYPLGDAREFNERLRRIEGHLSVLAELLHEVHDRTVRGAILKEYYTTQEIAQILKKRPYTVREWCRLGRVHGEKSHAGRGLDEEWRISHEELTRIQNEGLLPLHKFSDVERPRRLK